MGKELWFRTGDGRDICCEEGTAVHEMILSSGTFFAIDGPGGEPLAPVDSNSLVDLTKMTKKQLFEEAVRRDVPVTDQMSVLEIRLAIAAKTAGTEEGDRVDLTKMKKAELLAHAESLGIEADKSLTNAQIIELIEAKKD